mmetsp:Transcript_19540/g.39451  ORF Transcript_19540/g.39451 Transcript_19540/m.39451 type:complete len:266 (+) Transcript_19540:86-883(+)
MGDARYQNSAASWLNETADAVGPPPFHLIWGQRMDSRSHSETVVGSALGYSCSHDSSESPQVVHAHQQLLRSDAGSSDVSDRGVADPYHILYSSSHSVDAEVQTNPSDRPECVPDCRAGGGAVLQSDSGTDEDGARGGGAARGDGGRAPPQWSAGSALHEAGRCKPCMFVNTIVGCTNGSACDFCHLRHQRKHVTRANKTRRDRYKAIVERQALEAGIIPPDSSVCDASGRDGDGGPAGRNGAQGPLRGSGGGGRGGRARTILQL